MKPEPATFPPESPSATQQAQASPTEPTTPIDPALLDHPLFQQLVTELAEAREHIKAQAYVLESIAGVLRECEVASEARSTEESMQNLRNHLNDARSLYRVMRGEQKASEFLSGIEKLVPPEIFSSIVLDLSIFLAPRLRKLVEELSDPEKRTSNAPIIAAMLVTGLKAWEAHRPIFEHRMVTVQHLERTLNKLCDSAGITDEGEKKLIEDEISRVIGGDALALSRVEVGDFSEVERLFAEREQRQRKAIH